MCSLFSISISHFYKKFPGTLFSKAAVSLKYRENRKDTRATGRREPYFGTKPRISVCTQAWKWIQPFLPRQTIVHQNRPSSLPLFSHSSDQPCRGVSLSLVKHCFSLRLIAFINTYGKSKGRIPFENQKPKTTQRERLDRRPRQRPTARIDKLNRAGWNGARPR